MASLLLSRRLCCVVMLVVWLSLCGVARANDAAVRSKVYMDIDYRNNFIGRVIIGLYDDDLPLTVANFKQLCVGYKDLSYRGTTFHRILRDALVIGGEVKSNVNGSGGWSIYGSSFPDESFKYKHERGAVSMVNFRRNNNGSQFLIALTALSYLDDKQVVFGKVLAGLDVIETVSRGKMGLQMKALSPAYIGDCGILNE